MTGGHRHSQYCLKISGIHGNAWFPQLTVTYTSLYGYILLHLVTCFLHLSQVHKYQEEFEAALRGFSRASALDPLWGEPKEKEAQMLKLLTQVQELVVAKVELL